ncbi:hypothetical protein [Nonomuraea sp. JJY05]|uniref:hypothetical protein n=1 Tax=Nonomuraea sp. JJY05 TaxID=3350255 RepID=UPI00373EABAF
MRKDAALALKERAEQQAADKEAAGDAWVGNELVVTTKHGTPYEPRNCNRHFHAACQQAGVRLIKVHDTRRTCASLLVALEVHPHVAMQILRRSEIAVTMEISDKGDKERSQTPWRQSRPIGTAALCCCTKIKRATPCVGMWPLIMVGDTGIEPVTSSV